MTVRNPSELARLDEERYEQLIIEFRDLGRSKADRLAILKEIRELEIVLDRNDIGNYNG